MADDLGITFKPSTAAVLIGKAFKEAYSILALNVEWPDV